MNGWIYLIVAGVFEVGFASTLKLTESFTKLVPSIVFFIFGALSFYSLTKAVATLPIGTAYAVWTGIGAFGTILVGVFFYGESMSILKAFFLVTLVGSIVGLKLVSN